MTTHQMHPHWLLAQNPLETGEKLDALFKEPNLQAILQAAITLAIAYGLLVAIQSFTTGISEKVPRRFR
ncbi:MAG: hypothetical protein AAGF98_16235, partial [Cyanobacteria bacterium P01_H01_bin.153]